MGAARGCRATEARPDFRCSQCGDLFEVEYPGWVPAQGPDRPNPGALKWLWRERRCSSEALDHSGVWRFRELLPILESFGNAVTLREGNTPLYHLPRAAKALGIDQLFAKHQGMNPTGSFKDTGMTAALSVARERGFEWVACASTGNTSAAMAAYAARAGLRSLVLIPEGKIAWGKLSQAMDYGAVTCQLKTDFDGCVRVLTTDREASADLSAEFGESVPAGRAEDAGASKLPKHFDWNVPDHLIVPGGNLANSSALGKGFREMRELGLVARMPRISVIQAEGANPLVRSFGCESRRVAGAGGGAHAGDGDSHRQSGVVAQGGAGDSGDRRLVPGCDRGGDCDCQGRDWRGRAGLRAGLGGDAGGAEEAARARQGCRRRDGGAGADRAHAEGCRLHHRLPSRNAA